MIDWTNLLFNSFWILALSIALAIVSWASWRASVNQTKLLHELKQVAPQRGLHFSGFLFSLGLALTASTVPEKILWFLLAAYFLVQVVLSIYGPSLKGLK